MRPTTILPRETALRSGFRTLAVGAIKPRPPRTPIRPLFVPFRGDAARRFFFATFPSYLQLLVWQRARSERDELARLSKFRVIGQDLSLCYFYSTFIFH